MSLASFTPEQLLAHDGFVRALARALLFDEQRAEDAAQETWIAALGAEAPPRSIRAWLATLVRNAARDRLRSEEARARRERIAARAESISATDEILAREEARHAVVRAVSRLEEPTRSVLLLRYFEGLPPREIARRLGVPVETIRSRIKRGLARLRGELGSQRSSLLVLAVGPIAPAIVAPLLAMTLKSKLALSAAAVLLAIGLGVGTIALRESAPAENPTRGTLASESSAVEARRSDLPAASETQPARVSEAPASARALATLVVRARWVPYGAPAAEIPIRVEGHADLRTDERGLVRFEQLEAGEVHVTAEPFRGSSYGGFSEGVVTERFDEREDVAPRPFDSPLERGGGRLVAGRTTVVTLILDRGYRVLGEVVDGAGHGVADAEVWATPGSGRGAVELDAAAVMPGQTVAPDPLVAASRPATPGQLVARTAPNGTFELDRGGWGWRLTARKPGFAFAWSESRSLGVVHQAEELRRGTPSREVGAARIDGPRGEVRLRIQLLQRDAPLNVRVFEPSGRPAARARLALASRSIARPQGSGRYDEGPPDFFATTGDDGRFRFEGVSAGEHRLWARFGDAAPWTAPITLKEGETSEIEARLEAGASASGIVNIVSSARHAAEDVEVELATEQYDSEVLYPFSVPHADVSPQGSYRIAGLPAGKKFSLIAFVPGYSNRVTSPELFAKVGETIVWNTAIY